MRPIIIDITHDPVSSFHGLKLSPYPTGSPGYRLFKMLRNRIPGVMQREYLDCFDRRSLVVGIEYDKQLAATAAENISVNLRDSGRTIVLLGQDVRRAFGHSELLLHPQFIGGCTWRQLPHPSGRNLWYNEPENWRLASLVLEELYLEYRKKVIVSCSH